jgi:hypothetical protein
METDKIKREKAISLADCSCIATAKLADAKAVFARKKEPSQGDGKETFQREIRIP